MPGNKSLSLRLPDCEGSRWQPKPLAIDLPGSAPHWAADEALREDTALKAPCCLVLCGSAGALAVTGMLGRAGHLLHFRGSGGGPGPSIGEAADLLMPTPARIYPRSFQLAVKGELG